MQDPSRTPLSGSRCSCPLFFAKLSREVRAHKLRELAECVAQVPAFIHSIDFAGDPCLAYSKRTLTLPEL